MAEANAIKESRIDHTNPLARFFFNGLLCMDGALFLWALISALVFGGGYWVGVIVGIIGALIIWGLAEFSGAYDEVITLVDDE